MDMKSALRAPSGVPESESHPDCLGGQILFSVWKRNMCGKYPDLVAGKKMVCLCIGDDYAFMDEELQELLKSRVEEYIL